MPKFVLLDTETTGGGEQDRICQLGFLILEGAMCEAVESFCKPPLPISYGAMAVHHITNEAVADKPPFEATDAAKRLSQINTQDTIVVIHNAPFDLGMLAKEGITWQGPVIDTLRCIRHLQPELESHSLQYLRYALGFYKEEAIEASKLGITVTAHDAMGDVLVLKLLMKHLVALVNRDISVLIALTQRPIVIQKFRFGKYKDRLIEEIVRSDLDYIGWMLDKMEMDDDLRFTLCREVTLSAIEKLIDETPLAMREKVMMGWAMEHHDKLDLTEDEWELVAQTAMR